MSVTMRQMPWKQGVHSGIRPDSGTRKWHPSFSASATGSTSSISSVRWTSSSRRPGSPASWPPIEARCWFVGTKRQAREILVEEAHRSGMPFVDQRWLGGMLTNYKTIKTSIKRLKEMEQTKEEGGLDRMPKKEGLHFQREIDKLNKAIGGIKEMNALPDALFVNRRRVPQDRDRRGEQARYSGGRGGRYQPFSGGHCVRDPGQRRLQSRGRLYARGVADAILEGKANASLGVVASVTDDEFVEVSEDSGPEA